MRRSPIVALLGVAACLALTACSTPSINSIYSEDQSEVVRDDRIVGLWRDDNSGKDSSRYRVSTASADSKDDAKDKPPAVYRLTIENSSGVPQDGEFEVRLVRLGATDFIDCYPAHSETKAMGDRLGMAAMPMHIIMPVVIKDDHVTVRPLDLGKVHALVSASPHMTPHAIRDKDIVILTGTTRQVQEFFRKVAGGDEVFDKTMELVRVPADEQPRPGAEAKPTSRGRALPIPTQRRRSRADR